MTDFRLQPDLYRDTVQVPVTNFLYRDSLSAPIKLVHGRQQSGEKYPNFEKKILVCQIVDLKYE
jgi:hypothetical protein